jgi:uncharacterized repeat protein (TIGR03803 family)
VKNVKPLIFSISKKSFPILLILFLIFFNLFTLPLSVKGATFNLLHEFAGGVDDGMNPNNSLILSGSTLYGMTAVGGDDNLGTIFSIATNGTGFTLLHEFAGGADDGMNPYGSLILSGSTLYGMTASGGNPDMGTIFSINTNGTDFTLLHEFAGGADDGYPSGSLILSGSTLYGMTPSDNEGANNIGTIFSIATNGTGFTLLHEFAGGVDDGRTPYGSLILSGSTLYGMTAAGGDDNLGTIFSIATNGTGFTLLHEFAGGVDDGNNPNDSLILSDSTLYGMTNAGGDDNLGTIFSIATNGTGFTLLHEFAGGVDDGSNPNGSLILSDSTLYGMTAVGGDSDAGTIFSINTNGTGFTLLHEFAGGADDGRISYGSLILSDSTLYGMTNGGGDDNLGTIFSLTLDLNPPTVETFSPADDTIDIEINSNLVITFSEEVFADTGNITIKESSDDSVFETIDVTSDKVTGSGTDTITINPTNNLSYETGYYINIGDTAFEDAADNPYPGIADTTTWNFTTKCPPVANAISYNPHPICGAATCESGYILSQGLCVVGIWGGGGAFSGAASPTTALTTTVSATSGGTASATTSENTKATVLIPAGAVNNSAIINIIPTAKANISATASLPTGLNIVGNFLYNLTATSGSTNITNFNKTLTLTFTYTDNQITGLNESSLNIYRWSGTQWLGLPSTVNTITNTITATTTNFSYFAIMGGTSTQEKPTTSYSEIPSTFTFTKNLKSGMRDNDVVYLKYILASEGCVSGLLNTNYFASKTLAGTKCFCKKYKSEISQAAGYTVSCTGFVGTGMRAKLNSLLTGISSEQE